MVKRYFVLTLGQSNNEPQGFWTDYKQRVPEADYALSGNEALKQIQYLTFFNDKGAGGGSGYPNPLTPAPAPFGDASLEFQGYERYCTWQPWTAETAPANPPAGFQYPPHQCLPLSSYTFNQVSVGMDWARRIMNWLGQPIHVVHCAITSSSLAHSEIPIAGTSAYCWYDPNRHTNWSPSDDDALFQRMKTVMDGLELRLQADGDTGVCLGVLMMQGETDAQNDPSQSEQFATNMPRFIDAVRAEVASRGWLDTSASQLPFIWPQIQTAAWNLVGVAADINTPLQNLDEDDPFAATFSVDTMDFGGGIHFSGAGTVECGEQAFNRFLELRKINTLSMPIEDVPTLSELRTQVLRITERNTDDSGQDEATVNECINDAYMAMFKKVGDTAWWLRQTFRYRVRSAPDSPVNLPRRVGRLLEIRPAAYPWVSVDFSMVQHADEGRVQIITMEDFNEECDLHYMHEPLKLVANNERPAIPKLYIECLKVGAARRLAYNAGNSKLEAKLQREEAKQMGEMFEHANKVDRQRRERLRGRRRTRYRRKPWETRSFYPWVDAGS